MLKSILRFTAFFLTVCWSVVSVAHDEKETEPSPLDREPFAYSYHGVLVDTSTKEIEISPRYIEAALHFYTEAAVRATNFDGYQQYVVLNRAILEQSEFSDLDKIKIRAQVADLVFSNSLDDKKATKLDDETRFKLMRWREKVSALKLNVPKAFKWKLYGEELAKKINGLPKQTRTALTAIITKNRIYYFQRLEVMDFLIWPDSWFVPDSTPYMDQCREAGVPVPPAFGSTHWKYVGQLNNEFIDASGRARAYTYTSSSPEPIGTCIALPRLDANDAASVLGIICLGLETENACFWDKYNTSAQELAGTIPISEFVSGVDFTGSAGNCSSCHAGENPFVIHPEADISGGANISVNWHNPIFNPTWPRNPGPITLPADTSYSSSDWWNPFSWFDEREPGASCVACHKLPDVSHSVLQQNFGYCDSVLNNAARLTMAPWSSSKAGWGASNNSEHRVHIERLWDLCN